MFSTDIPLVPYFENTYDKDTIKNKTVCGFYQLNKVNVN